MVSELIPCAPYPGDLCQVCVHVLVADLYHLSDPLVVTVGRGSSGSQRLDPRLSTRVLLLTTNLNHPQRPPWVERRVGPRPGGRMGWYSLLHHLLVGRDLLGIEQLVAGRVLWGSEPSDTQAKMGWPVSQPSGPDGARPRTHSGQPERRGSGPAPCGPDSLLMLSPFRNL